MTKKDSEAIARIVNQLVDQGQANNRLTGTTYTFSAVRKTAVQLADYLATTNPRFNREKFLLTCGFSSL